MILTFITLLTITPSTLTAPPTILFFIPNGTVASQELEATVQFGMVEMRRALWVDIQHVIIDANQDSVVKSLIDHLEFNIIAVLGVFTDAQISDIGPILETYKLPTFVLNRLSNPLTRLQYVFSTTPNIKFELDGLGDILEYYEWDDVGYFIQANSSIVDVSLDVDTQCWNKTIVDAPQITQTTCTNFSVIVIVGYPNFMTQFLDHLSNQGCSNLVVLQYFLGNSVPHLPTIIKNNHHLGDLIFLFPKSYPMIETGTSKFDKYKYSCLHPSCLKFKIRQQYRQTESVLLLLDSLTLIENLLLVYEELIVDDIRGFGFSSVIGEQAKLLEEGFSYNRINILKSGSNNEVEVLGFLDQYQLYLGYTVWRSTMNDRPLRTDSACSTNSSLDEGTLKTTESSFTVTAVLTLVLILTMFVAVFTIYATQSRRNDQLDRNMGLLVILSCVTILLTTSMVFESSQVICLTIISKDIAEFSLFSVILFSCVFRSINQLFGIIFTAVLIFGKIVSVLWSMIQQSNSGLYCLSNQTLGRVFIIGVVLLDMLLMSMKYRQQKHYLKCLIPTLGLCFISELMICFIGIPTPCTVAIITIRIVLMNAALTHFFQTTLKQTGFENKYVKTNNVPDLDTDKTRRLYHNTNGGIHCRKNEINEVIEDEPPLICKYIESPQLFWDDDDMDYPTHYPDETTPELSPNVCGHEVVFRSNGTLSDIEELDAEDDIQQYISIHSNHRDFVSHQYNMNGLRSSQYAIVTSDSIVDDIVLLKLHNQDSFA